MKLFIDTNIIIDLVADRQPFSKWAYEIFKAQKEGVHILYTSSSSILTSYYLLEKHIGASKAKGAIKTLLDRLQIQAISNEMMQTALTTRFKDYEDAVQHECAKSIPDIKYIVTRNNKDYRYSSIKTVSPEELVVK